MTAADALSPRQRDVARLAALGYTNEEIGAALGMTPGTAKIHLHHAMVRVGVGNRTRLALWAAHVGIVTPAEVRDALARLGLV